MKRRRFRGRRLLISLLAALSLQGCYVTKQALYQNNLFNSRRKVSDLLADPKTAAKTKKNLLISREIIDFASKKGLNAAGAYSYYIDTEEPVVSYLVQAAESDRLEAVSWWFPVVGRVPYIGYFRRSERDEKARELRDAGYDVYESGVGAYSSLGWFDDPLFSPMLNRGEVDLAHLLFHELTHRTLWVAGSTEFNENLAEYVADGVTIDYLQAKGMTDAIKTYEGKKEDRLTFNNWLIALKKELQILYNKPPSSRKDLLAAKGLVFKRYTEPPIKPSFKVGDFVGKASDWNNASVLGASLYSPDMTRFAKADKCVGGSAKDFLAALDKAADETGDGFKALDLLCDKVPHVD